MLFKEKLNLCENDTHANITHKYKLHGWENFNKLTYINRQKQKSRSIPGGSVEMQREWRAIDKVNMWVNLNDCWLDQEIVMSHRIQVHAKSKYTTTNSTKGMRGQIGLQCVKALWFSGE